MPRLVGRTALITGASSGLGWRFGEIMAREGAKVVLAARRKERLDALVQQIEKAGGQALAVACDVTDEPSVIAAFDAAENRFGVVDTVVNNAGMSTSMATMDQSAEEFRKVMDLNVTAVFLVAREAARRLLKADAGPRGRIVNVASMAGRIVVPGVPAYCASKAGVAHLTRALARDWAKYGINVNALSPGYVMTELTEDWLASDYGTKFIGKMPRRRVMDADSLDEALLFLASDGAKFVTGTDLLVDDAQSI